MNYIKDAFLALRKTLFSVLLIALPITLGVWFSMRERVSLLIPLGVMLLVWLALSAFLVYSIAAMMKKEQPLTDILEEKGYCDEYLQTYDRIYPTPDRAHLLRKIDILASLRRYDEAWKLLDSVKTIGLDDTAQMQYYNCRLDLLLSEHRFDEAKQELDKCRKFMDIYANAHPTHCVAYGCNAAVILATAGDFEGSEHYLRAAEHTVEGMRSTSPVVVMIARTMQLYALGFDTQAEAQAEKTRLEIETSPHLSREWQKYTMRQLLARAEEVAPANREEAAL